MHDNDQQLMEAYRRDKSDAAFRAIVEHHAPWVFAAAFRQLRDRHLAEDSTQTVFILLARKSTSMPDSHKLSGWLFTTLRYTVKNIARSRRRSQRLEAKLAAEVTSPHASATDAANAGELALQLDAAVAHLPEAERTAILLRFYQDQSYEQIAGALGITEPTARKRVSRGTVLLRKRLGASATASALGTAAALGLAQSPPALAASIHTAVAAGAALPTSLAATVKGTAALMAITKAQTVAAIVLVSAAILIPVGAIALRSTASQPVPPAPLGIAAPGGDNGNGGGGGGIDAVAAFQRLYTLNDNQYVALYPPPFAAVREAYFRDPRSGVQITPADVAAGVAAPGGAAANTTPTNAVFTFENGQPRLSMLSTDRGLSLAAISSITLGLLDSDIRGSGRDIQLTGDILYRAGAVPEKICADLQSIVQSRLQKNVLFTYTTAPRPWIVVKGDWHFTPYDQLKDPPQKKLIELQMLKSLATPGVGEAGGAAGAPGAMKIETTTNVLAITAQEAAPTLSALLHKPVAIEAKNLPPIFMVVVADDLQLPAQQNAILNILARQTGLTWSEENRPGPQLTIDAK